MKVTLKINLDDIIVESNDKLVELPTRAVIAMMEELDMSNIDIDEVYYSQYDETNIYYDIVIEVKNYFDILNKNYYETIYFNLSLNSINEFLSTPVSFLEDGSVETTNFDYCFDEILDFLETIQNDLRMYGDVDNDYELVLDDEDYKNK